MTNDGKHDRLKARLEGLSRARVPVPGRAARAAAMNAALATFDGERKNPTVFQGSGPWPRLTRQTKTFWGKMMDRKLIAAPAVAGLLAMPVAGYVAWQMMGEGDGPAFAPTATGESGKVLAPTETAETPADGEVAASGRTRDEFVPAVEEALQVPLPAPLPGRSSVPGPQARDFAQTRDLMPPASPPADAAGRTGRMTTLQYGGDRQTPDLLPPAAGDRLERFDTNPVRSVLESPVSTFSIDVDTASYSFVRRALNRGVMPDPETVRVEEMINYFPYDWPGPQGADTPFNATVSVMPTPWNDNTQLMHVAIKGYELDPAERPRANLVFLVDTSGSMAPDDRLPLVRTSLRLLLDRLDPHDTVSIVTYAGQTSVALEPTAVSDRAAILAAIDALEARGSTAGAAGLREAYRMAEASFVEGGVNRILLATDGDFNVGETSDEALKRLVREKRETGIHLSVLGFGYGNFNDQLMQAIAQNGNGTAAYIDTLAEAQKVLVEEASSTLFTIAGDVKLQVEFNPARVAEYRLVGHETRALAREDFNNDRVDAGEVGSGHSMAAIYEIVPVGSPARLVDDLRYGRPDGQEAGDPLGEELAFLRMRYKLPGEDESRLIERVVTDADALDTFEAASDDHRFSVAVAAFGQKLRRADATAGLDYGEILEIAAAARGADPFGYRAEFLSLVRIASALDGER